jgi:hypothetical protein
MKLNLPNGIIAEGTVSECQEVLAGQKKAAAKAERVMVKVTRPHRGNYRRKPWTGEELAKIAETINLPIKQALKEIPTRTQTSLWNIRGIMRKNNLPLKLQKKLNDFLHLR